MNTIYKSLAYRSAADRATRELPRCATSGGRSSHPGYIGRCSRDRRRRRRLLVGSRDGRQLSCALHTLAFALGCCALPRHDSSSHTVIPPLDVPPKISRLRLAKREKKLTNHTSNRNLDPNRNLIPIRS